MTYDQALKGLNLENLKTRRHKLALKFAENCLKNDEMKDLFPLKEENEYNFRQRDKYEVKFAYSSRLYNSTVPTLQRMLNQKHRLIRNYC